MDNLSGGRLPAVDDQSPPLVPVNTQRSLQQTVEEAEDEDEDEMPSLMSVSDSSDEGSISADEDDNSDWEDEDDAEFDDDFRDLPPLEPFLGAHPHQGNGPEDIPPLEPITPSSSSRSPAILDSVWLPPHHGSPADDLVQLISTLYPHLGQHIGRTPGQNMPEDLVPHLPREVFQLLDTLALQGQSTQRQSEPDPERAKVLVKGLETVPEGLLTRLTRVGGAPGGHEDMSSGEESVAGCAVCWAPFVDNKSSNPELVTDRPLPFASETDEEPRVVCLPCSHIFHASCLLPWFSRTTTCPTCRFDIDPDSLTSRQHRRPLDGTTNANQSPIDDWEDESDAGDDDDDDDRSDFEDELQEGSESEAALNFGADFSPDFFNRLFASVGHRGPRPRRRKWILPDAPGKSLREWIVRKEYELGLRCLDATCILGPTDIDPTAVGVAGQISIRMEEECDCKHMVHPACLVMSARMAGRTPVAQGDEDVEISCPSCRGIGFISRQAWDEGVVALTRVQ